MTSRDPAVPARRDPSAAAPGPRLRLVGGGDEPAAAAAGRSAGEKTQELFERHHRRLVGFLRRLTSAEQAEEIAQEVYFRVLQVKNLENRELNASYLFRIGENLVRKRYHREQRRRRADEAIRYDMASRERRSTDSIESDGPENGSTEMAFVGSRHFHQAMELLTDNEQAAIRLIICRGLSYDQAARSLGVGVSTINNWKHRGVKKLRQLIDANQRFPGSSRVRGSRDSTGAAG